MFELSFIWAGLIAFAVLVYVILDGFDLGVGILFPFVESEEDRDVIMNTVAPVWDGNETWLVLGGGGLFAVFPLAYAVVMPALYMPIILMLLALVFRGVAFEYRWKTKRWKHVWSIFFAVGSYLATLCQGIALGALVQGIELDGRAYGGGWWDWLTPFSVLTGVALMFGYALLGATWINLKTEGTLQATARQLSFWLALATLGFIGLVSILTPFQDPVYFERWFSGHNAVFSFLVPLLMLGISYKLFDSLRKGGELTPFVMANAIFVCCFIGIGISFYPHIVPPDLTIEQAAAPDSSLAFALVGAAILIPIILIYTGYAYWVFRGKVCPGDGYH
ncbi:cytochrome d ubiquinol oxidase subunit II [Litorisediminicola beolgyonensis]|uniref:Cytochrome d ubiquinol oxidase subunit II n=1 Tax=Litorisediminicola beolgyonensis TaxID=1173614 RepID=A0ABW3ZKR7_9RHOB